MKWGERVGIEWARSQLELWKKKLSGEKGAARQLTRSVESLSPRYIINSSIDSDQHSSIWLVSVERLQFSDGEIFSEFWQFRFTRWRRLWRLSALEDFEDEKCNDGDQRDVQRAVDDFLDDSVYEADLFHRFYDFIFVFHIAHLIFWNLQRNYYAHTLTRALLLATNKRWSLILELKANIFRNFRKQKVCVPFEKEIKEKIKKLLELYSDKHSPSYCMELDLASTVKLNEMNF